VRGGGRRPGARSRLCQPFVLRKHRGSRYATLFFADYDDSSRRPPLRELRTSSATTAVRRRGAEDQASRTGKVQRLDATSMVVGLFSDWQCEVAEVRLAPGDTLVLYTDGITEARSAKGEEFGESRLIDTLRSYCHLPVGPLLKRSLRQSTNSAPENNRMTSPW